MPGQTPCDLDPLVLYARELGVELTAAACQRLERLVSLLLEFNERVHLTSVVDLKEIIDRHLSDSIALASFLSPSARRIIDIGSGSGFPALPLAILRPETHFTLVESNGRKVAYLREASRSLGLSNVTVEGERVEIVARDPRHREIYDLAIARAFASLPVVLECSLPLLSIGGRLIAPRGCHALDEALQATGIPELLGGEFAGVGRYRLLSGVELETVVVVKTTPSPARYPRRPGLPARRPLTCGKCGKTCG